MKNYLLVAVIGLEYWSTGVLGIGLVFTVIFVGLGATATVLGNFLFANLIILKRVAGAIIIVFGLHMAGLFRIKFLDYQKSFNFQNKQVRFVNSFVLGLAFSFAWIPCIGPILATILTYAATKDTVIEGILMLIVYSLGLGVPFFLMSIGMGKFIGILDRIKRHFRTIEIVSGSLLVLIGILILTDNLERLTYYFSFLGHLFPWLTTVMLPALLSQNSLYLPKMDLT